MKKKSNLDWARAIWEKAKTPANVRAHMKKVAQVAALVGRAAKKWGFRVDLEFLVRCALVHDACKIEAMQTGQNEKQLLAQLLKNKPEILAVVKQTDFPFLLREQAFANIESIILFYADKRVRHTEVVSLHARILDLLKRYPMFGDEIRAAAPRTIELETALVRQFKFPKALGGMK
jgi:hypothetical protein